MLNLTAINAFSKWLCRHLFRTWFISFCSLHYIIEFPSLSMVPVALAHTQQHLCVLITSNLATSTVSWWTNRCMRYEIEQKSKSENVRSLSISFSLCVSEVNRSSTFFFTRRWNSKCVTYQEKSESFDADLMCLVVCESNKSENGRRMAESERDKWKEKSSCNGNCSQKGDWCAFAHQPLIHF